MIFFIYFLAATCVDKFFGKKDYSNWYPTLPSITVLLVITLLTVYGTEVKNSGFFFIIYFIVPFLYLVVLGLLLKRDVLPYISYSKKILSQLILFTLYLSVGLFSQKLAESLMIDSYMFQVVFNKVLFFVALLVTLLIFFLGNSKRMSLFPRIKTFERLKRELEIYVLCLFSYFFVFYLFKGATHSPFLEAEISSSVNVILALFIFMLLAFGLPEKMKGYLVKVKQSQYMELHFNFLLPAALLLILILIGAYSGL